MNNNELFNKKVAVLGLSTEGGDTTEFLVSRGSKVICCDRRSVIDLGEIYRKLKKYPVDFLLGNKYLDSLDEFDLLVRTPGMALFLPELLKAKLRGQQITSQTKLFFDYCQAPIIGVTGTKGKGTTSTLISEMLKMAGLKVWLGGNVGQPLLSKVNHIQKKDIVILELSSFQLEDLHKSPSVAVVLKTTQEHLANFDPLATNYHKTKTDYVQSKTAIVKFQTEKDYAVFNAEDPTSLSFAKLTSGEKKYFGHNKKYDAFIESNSSFLKWNGKTDLICSLDQIKLRGLHNLENICASALAVKRFNVSNSIISKVAKSFSGLEHRLELVRYVNGVRYYNDSFSTVPETTIAAIKSFTEPINLIAGGSEKGSDFTDLGKEIISSGVKTLILIGQMADKIEQSIKKIDPNPKFKIIRGKKNMAEIIDTAIKNSQTGDIVLLSPACASFDMFKNYKERGKLFKAYVKQIRQTKN